MASSESYVQAVDSKYITRVALGDSYTTNKEAISRMLDDGTAANTTALAAILGALPSYSLTAKRRDTTLGGNDAINCYYQFNENDDLIHPINKTNTSDTGGMGRVYNETFDEQQQLLYLSFGVPDFSSASEFLKNAFNAELASLMNTGDNSIIGMAGRFLGKVAGTVLVFPFLPLKLAVDLLTNTATPTKYYDFKPTQALYYRVVNTMLAHLAVNMNLASTEADNLTDGIPDILKKHGLDILTILSRKHWYDRLSEAGSTTSPNTDEMLKILSTDPMYEQNMWKNATTGANLGFTEALRYVGFRIEKSADSSETASNTTKEPEILNLINSQVQAGKDRTINWKPLENTTIGSLVGNVYKGIESIFSGVADSLNIQGGIEMLKGSGFVDIPDVWASSSFQKSYSFDFQLRTPFGDPFSVFYSLYVPLVMLIAGAFPRSTGQNSYTSPFLVRAYCKGMFAIPLGIIDSITIKRGAAEYGWSADMLPTQIDISFTIKDLSPIMHMAIADGGFSNWMNILGQNSTFQEYLLTLSGVNIAQRSLKLDLLSKRSKALLKILSNNKLNPIMVGFSLANTKLGRLITKITPISRLPGSTNIPKIQ